MKYYIIIKSPKASVEAAMKSVTEKAMDLTKGLVGAGAGAMTQGQFSTANGGVGSYFGAKGGNTGLPNVLNVRLVGGRLDTLGIVGAIDAETYKSKLKMMNRENPGADENLNKESLFFNRDNIAKNMLKEQNAQEGRERANAEALQKLANGDSKDGKDKKKDKKKGLFELLSEETYVYDKNGKLLRIDDTKASSNREYIVITFENFKDGKYVKTVEVNGIQAFKTCYDKDGNEIEWAWITYSPEEQIQTFILYSGIKKDKYGNLIEKTGKYLEITDGGKKIGKETGVIAEEMKIEYKYYE